MPRTLVVFAAAVSTAASFATFSPARAADLYGYGPAPVERVERTITREVIIREQPYRYERPIRRFEGYLPSEAVEAAPRPPAPVIIRERVIIVRPAPRLPYEYSCGPACAADW